MVGGESLIKRENDKGQECPNDVMTKLSVGGLLTLGLRHSLDIGA
jgi:hypothetical protein